MHNCCSIPFLWHAKLLDCLPFTCIGVNVWRFVLKQNRLDYFMSFVVLISSFFISSINVWKRNENGLYPINKNCHTACGEWLKRIKQVKRAFSLSPDWMARSCSIQMVNLVRSNGIGCGFVNWLRIPNPKILCVGFPLMYCHWRMDTGYFWNSHCLSFLNWIYAKPNGYVRKIPKELII